MSTLPNMDNNKAYVLRDRSSANIEQWPAPKAPGPNGKHVLEGWLEK